MGYFLSLSKETNEHLLNASELMLLVCGLVLAYGAAGEYLEEHGKLPRWMMWTLEPKLVFVWMVAISLFGEFAGDAGVYIFSGQLQTLSDAELAQLKNQNLKLQGQVGDTAEKLRLANNRFDAVEKRADALDKRFDAADKQLDEVHANVAKIGKDTAGMRDRSAILIENFPALVKELRPFHGQRVVTEICGAHPLNLADSENDDTQHLWTFFIRIFSPDKDDAGWAESVNSNWAACPKFFGVAIWYRTDAPEKTRQAAEELNKALSKYLPANPWPFPMLHPIRPDTPLTQPPFDGPTSPIVQVLKEPKLIVVIVGTKPVPVDISKLKRKAKSR